MSKRQSRTMHSYRNQVPSSFEASIFRKKKKAHYSFAISDITGIFAEINGHCEKLAPKVKVFLNEKIDCDLAFHHFIDDLKIFCFKCKSYGIEPSLSQFIKYYFWNISAPWVIFEKAVA